MKKVILALFLCSLSLGAFAEAGQVSCGPNAVVNVVHLLMKNMDDIETVEPLLIFNHKTQESKVVQIEKNRSGLKSISLETNKGSARHRTYEFKNLNSKSCFKGRGVKESAAATVDIVNSYGVVASFECKCL